MQQNFPHLFKTPLGARNNLRFLNLRREIFSFLLTLWASRALQLKQPATVLMKFVELRAEMLKKLRKNFAWLQLNSLKRTRILKTGRIGSKERSGIKDLLAGKLKLRTKLLRKKMLQVALKIL